MQTLRAITIVPAPPITADARDTVWTSLLTSVEERVIARGLPPPELVLFSADRVWQVPLEQAAWPGFEPELSALFASLGANLGVLRRFRLAHIALGGRPGSTAAAVFELLAPKRPGDPAGYQVALLPLTQQGGWQRVTGTWRTSYGDDVTRLDPPLRRQVDPGAPEPKRPWLLGQRAPVHGSSRLRPVAPPPDPTQLGHMLAGEMIGEVLANTEDRLEAYVFREGVVERWGIRRGIVVSVHDVLRNIAGETATAVVLVAPTVAEVDGDLQHALCFTVELADRTRGGVLVPLQIGHQGARVAMSARDLPTASGNLWIGVPAKVNLNLVPAGD